MKTLILIRHAKSSWKYEDLKDDERPLNERGRRDAPLMAEQFNQLKLRPDLIISSYAVRALTTAIVFADELAYPLESLKLSERLYEATADTLLDVISELPDQYQHVALFGHNPGFTDLINKLTKDEMSNLPTAGIAVIELSVKLWAQIVKVAAEQKGELVYFSSPKQVGA